MFTRFLHYKNFSSFVLSNLWWNFLRLFFRLCRQHVSHQDFHSLILASIDNFINQSFCLYLLVVILVKEKLHLPIYLFIYTHQYRIRIFTLFNRLLGSIITYFDIQITPDFKNMYFNNTSDSKKLCELGQVILLLSFNFSFCIRREPH